MNIKRIASIVAAVLLLLLIGVPISSYLLLKNRNLREWLKLRVEERTGWEVDYDNHAVSLLGDITIDNLRIASPDGLTVAAARTRVRPSILRLFTGKLYLKEVEIQKPDIRIPLPSGEPARSPDPSTDQGPDADREMPIGDVRVRGGTLELARPEGPLTLNDIQLHIRPNAEVDASMELGSPGNRLTVHAVTRQFRELQSADAAMRITDVAGLSGLLGRDLPLNQLDGEITATIQPDTDGYDLNVKIHIPTLIPGGEYPAVNLPLEGVLTIRSSRDFATVAVPEGQLQLADASIRISGTAAPALSLKVSGTNLKADDLIRRLPPDISPVPPEIGLSGTIQFDATVHGAERFRASVQMPKIGVTIPGSKPLTVTGTMLANPTSLTLEQTRVTGDWLDATLTGTVTEYMSANPRTKLNVHVWRGTFSGTDASGTSEQPASTGTDTPLTYPSFDGVHHDLTLTIDHCSVGGLEMVDVLGNLTADDQATSIRIDRGTIMDGSMNFTATIRPEAGGMKLETRGSVTGVAVKPVRWPNIPVDGGRADLAFDCSGSGDTLDALKHNLNGTVRYHLSETTVRDTPAVRKVSELLGIPLAGERVNPFDGNARISDGWTNLAEQALKTAPLAINLSGRVSLTGELDVNPVVTVSEEAAQQLPGTIRKLSGGGPVTIPLRLTGTLTEPKVTADTSALLEKAGEKLKNRLMDKLFKKK